MTDAPLVLIIERPGAPYYHDRAHRDALDVTDDDLHELSQAQAERLGYDPCRTCGLVTGEVTA